MRGGRGNVGAGPAVAVAVMLCLAACAAPSARWTKPGQTEAQVLSAQDACRNQADRAAGRPPAGDVEIGIGLSIGSASPTAQIDRDDYVDRFDRAMASCMAGKGFRRLAPQ